MARTKHVCRFDMVAHLWAHKSQEWAKNPAGNFYFQGDTIYSYGSHFPIARHVENKRGESVVLFTTRGYSHSTECHKSIVARACSHLKTFHVDDVRGSYPREQFDEYRARFVELGRRYVKARSNKPRILSEMEGLISEANAFAKFFGLRCRLRPVDNENWQAKCKAIEKREADKRKRQAAEAAKQRAEQLREAVERLDKWTAGEALNHYSVYGPFRHDLPTRLRISGDTLETSLGAEVPLDHAIKAFRLIKQLHDKGQAYQRNGHTIHLGNFALDSVDTQGNVQAGCHNIEWAEIDRVAAIAGVN